MNTVKKIIAFAVVIFVTFRLIVISVSASFAAPFIAEETLKTLFIEALGASGSYSADDLEAWNYDDLKNEFEIQMKTNPNFKPKNAIPFLVSPNRENIPGTPEHVEKVQNDIRNLRKQNDEIIADWLNKMQAKGEEIYDLINPTYNVPIDMQGKGGAYKIPFANSGTKVDGYEIWLFDYAEIVPYSDGSYYYRFHNVHRDVYRFNGSFWFSQGDSTVLSSDPKVGEERYGDWRFEDGTKFGTDDEPIPIIGEADGVQITPDMLNPDGTVTINGTTYYPKDFIDLDKFKDTAIIDLLNEILKALDNSYVIDDSVPDVGFDDVAVDVPAELSDFTTPGIINVFPFCLPKDFVRGMYLFKAQPEVPHFETEIKIPAFLNVPEQKWKIEIDFKEFEPLAKITRWISLTSFVYVLILITPKIVKGAG